MVVLVTSCRRIASDGDRGFNRNDANNFKQYAKAAAATTTSSRSDANFDQINHLSSYFKKIVKKWRDNGEYHVMVDSDFKKAIDLSKLVYGITSTAPTRTPSIMAGVGSVLAANICSMVSAIEEKCAIFLGLPENVSLVKKMMAVYTATPESAALLYKSTLFNKTVSSRKKEKIIANIPSDMLEERFKSHVARPFRPSLFERFGTTASEEEIGASNGASTTLSASNTHAKTLVHFTKVACGGMRNSLDVISGLGDEEEEERIGVARSLLKDSVSPHLNDDAAILYGNATDCRAFAQIVKNEPLHHGIIPHEFTRDMERTPYVEIDRSNSAVTVYSDRFATNEHGNVVKTRKLISLKVNTGQLLCDMIYGSDWDIHLKDCLSLLGYEAFFDRDGTLKRRLKRLLFDKRKTDLGDLALVMVSRYIKKNI